MTETKDRHRRESRVCANCDAPFEAPTRSQQRFCSRSCIRHAGVADRFWAKVDTSGGLSACWPWTGSRDGHGYGKLTIDGHQILATHVSLELAGRPLDRGQEARHVVCDNPPCVNPAHLLAGTRADNMADLRAHGRRLGKGGLKGERNPAARLTSGAATEIRRRVAMGETRTAVADDLGVDRSTVGLVVSGKTWGTA